MGTQSALLVRLSVYDVVDQQQQNQMILNLNKVGRQLGLGGVFHGAVVLLDTEWSFGACDVGSGVYSCPAGRNPMYVFREEIVLGETLLSLEQVKEVLLRLQGEWQGCTYDLLQRNCCHFCEAFAAQLGVGPLPAWLNRLAANADATIAFTAEAVSTMRDIGMELQRVGGESLGFLRNSLHRASEHLHASMDDAGRLALQRSSSGLSNVAADVRESSNTSSNASALQLSASSAGHLASKLVLGAKSWLQPIADRTAWQDDGSRGGGLPNNRTPPLTKRTPLHRDCDDAFATGGASNSSTRPRLPAAAVPSTVDAGHASDADVAGLSSLEFEEQDQPLARSFAVTGTSPAPGLGLMA